jgi:pimeloyl-ACP methyl ester carboxylesterase
MHSGLDEAADWAVLVPGFTGSKEDFIALPPLLAEHGIGLLSYDQVGQHESDGSDQPGDYALPMLAADLAALIDEAARRHGRSDRPHLVGHSFGGLVAQQAVSTKVVQPRSLVLLCSGPGALPPERQGPLPTLVEALPGTDLGTLWRLKGEADERARARSMRVAAPSASVEAFLERRWMANHPMQLREFGRILLEQPALTDEVAAVVQAGLHTSVLWGEHDDAWPIPMQRALAQALGAQAFEIAGVGHSPNAEQPEALVAALVQAWR